MLSLIIAASLVDFTTPGVTYTVCAGRYRDDLAASQVQITAEGLTVNCDKDKSERPSGWLTMEVPQSVCSVKDWTGKLISLSMAREPSGRATKNIAINLVDSQGETFQFGAVDEVYNDRGEFSLVFDLNKAREHWGGDSSRDGVITPPLRFSAINIHYVATADEAGAGQAIFRAVDELPRPVKAAKVPRTVFSREKISTDTSYPGAAPFHGPSRLAFRTEPSFEGTARLTLSYGSMLEANRGTMTNFTAKAEKGVLRFDVNLPYDVEYEFYKLSCGTSKVTMAAGEFLQTAAEAMRLTVDTGHFLHIVRDGKNERPYLMITNPSDRDIAWQANIELADYFGRKLEIPFNHTVGKGMTVRVPVPWPLPSRGIWRVKAAVKGDDGSEAMKETRFAYLDLHEVTPFVERPKFRLGIHYHGTFYLPDHAERTIAALVAAGAKFVRTDYDFMWGAVEPTRGQYRWEKADTMLKMLRDAGMSLDIIFAGPPGWAIEQRFKDKVQEWQKAGQRVRYGSAPTIPGAFRDFAEKFARRYGRQIDYYEVGNEWDLAGTDTCIHEDLLRIQREAYEGVHAGCPDACVIPNGWTTSITHPDSNRKVWCLGLIESFAQHPELYDAWALHCHGSFNGFASSIENEFLPMRASTPLKNRPWLLNECALTSAGGREDEVAVAVWQKILWAWAHGSSDHIWYNLRATGWFDGGEPGYGLITCDYFPRSSYAAFAALSTVFQGLDADGIVYSKGRRHLLRFKGSSQALKSGYVFVGWDSQSKGASRRLVKMRTDATQAFSVDLMGNRTSAEIRNGVAEYHLGYYPSAIVLEGATLAEVESAADLAVEKRDVIAVSGANGNVPSFVLNSHANVKDLYEANPAMVHRLWKDSADHSAVVWLSTVKGGLKFRAAVLDDVSAEKDAVTISWSDPGKPARKLVLRPVRREGKYDFYEATLSAAGREIDLDFRIDDDDGDDGIDSYLFARSVAEGPIRVTF